MSDLNEGTTKAACGISGDDPSGRVVDRMISHKRTPLWWILMPEPLETQVRGRQKASEVKRSQDGVVLRRDWHGGPPEMINVDSSRSKA